MRSSIAFASDSRNSRPKTLGPPERDEGFLVAGLEGCWDANRANLSANPTEGIRAAIPRARRSRMMMSTTNVLSFCRFNEDDRCEARSHSPLIRTIRLLRPWAPQARRRRPPQQPLGLSPKCSSCCRRGKVHPIVIQRERFSHSLPPNWDARNSLFRCIHEPQTGATGRAVGTVQRPRHRQYDPRSLVAANRRA